MSPLGHAGWEKMMQTVIRFTNISEETLGEIHRLA